MDERMRLRIGAAMDGERVIVANIGRKVKVSEGELMVLATFARLGFLSACASVDGEVGEKAGAQCDELVERIRANFSREGRDDGFSRLSTSCAALLSGERFRGYIADWKDDAPTA